MCCSKNHSDLYGTEGGASAKAEGGGPDVPLAKLRDIAKEKYAAVSSCLALPSLRSLPRQGGVCKINRCGLSSAAALAARCHAHVGTVVHQLCVNGKPLACCCRAGKTSPLSNAWVCVLGLHARAPALHPFVPTSAHQPRGGKQLQLEGKALLLMLRALTQRLICLLTNSPCALQMWAGLLLSVRARTRGLMPPTEADKLSLKAAAGAMRECSACACTIARLGVL